MQIWTSIFISIGFNFQEIKSLSKHTSFLLLNPFPDMILSPLLPLEGEFYSNIHSGEPIQISKVFLMYEGNIPVLFKTHLWPIIHQTQTFFPSISLASMHLNPISRQ